MRTRTETIVFRLGFTLAVLVLGAFLALIGAAVLACVVLLGGPATTPWRPAGRGRGPRRQRRPREAARRSRWAERDRACRRACARARACEARRRRSPPLRPPGRAARRPTMPP